MYFNSLCSKIYLQYGGMVLRLFQCRNCTSCIASFNAKYVIYTGCDLIHGNGHIARKLNDISNLVIEILYRNLKPFYLRVIIHSSQLHCTFKLAVLVLKALHGLAPRYLADDCQLVTDAGRRHLRSSDSATCVLQRTNTRFGDRAFRLAGPSV